VYITALQEQLISREFVYLVSIQKDVIYADMELIDVIFAILLISFKITDVLIDVEMDITQSQILINVVCAHHHVFHAKMRIIAQFVP
jgi:hypothetical protein